jgi:hypothetical protein
MRWSWVTRGETLRTVRAVDTATDPDYQGRGIFRKLTLELAGQMEREGVAFVFNTPNDKSRPGYLKMGWQAVGRVSLWVRPSATRLAIRAIAGGRSEEPDEGLPVAMGSGLDLHSVEALCAAQRGSDRLVTPKDVAYLTWRYRRCPAFPYRFDTVDPERALVVSRTRSRWGLQELSICDVLVRPEQGGARAAAETLRRLFREVRPDYALCAGVPAGDEVEVMLRAGFLPAPMAGPILTVRPMNPTAIDPTRRASWAPAVGDLELF